MSTLLQTLESIRQEELLKSHFYIVLGGDLNPKGALLYATKEEATYVATERLQRNPTGKYYILESVACVKCEFPVSVVELTEKKETQNNESKT